MQFSVLARKAASTLLKVLPINVRMRIDFFRRVGYWPNVKAPSTFNEKVLYRKMYDRNPKFPMLADKLRVRDYVADRLGESVLTKLYGVVNSPDEIDLESLPDRFVIKATHDSGSVLLVDDKSKLSQEILESHFASRLKKVYGAGKGEWWYSQITPRLIIEEHLGEPGEPPPRDYKFFVFSGRVHIIQVDTDRFTNHTRTLYTPDSTYIDASLKYPKGNPVAKPEHLYDLIAAAERLGKGFDFVRVDLYSLPDRPVIFGELTFAPGSGYERFSPQKVDRWLGAKWQLQVCK